MKHAKPLPVTPPGHHQRAPSEKQEFQMYEEVQDSVNEYPPVKVILLKSVDGKVSCFRILGIVLLSLGGTLSNHNGELRQKYTTLPLPGTFRIAFQEVSRFRNRTPRWCRVSILRRISQSPVSNGRGHLCYSVWPEAVGTAKGGKQACFDQTDLSCLTGPSSNRFRLATSRSSHQKIWSATNIRSWLELWIQLLSRSRWRSMIRGRWRKGICESTYAEL